MAHLSLKDTEEAAAAVEKDRAEHTTGKLGAHMWVPFLGLPYGHILADQSRAPNSQVLSSSILASQTFSGHPLLSISTS